MVDWSGAAKMFEQYGITPLPKPVYDAQSLCASGKLIGKPR